MTQICYCQYETLIIYRRAKVMRLSLLLVFLSLVILTAAVAVLFQITKKRCWKLTYLAFPIFILSLLGCVLVFLTLTQNVSGLLKIFLMMAGFAPTVTIICVVLHNIISALISSLLRRDYDEAIFFLFALFGCPTAFLIGTLGSIALIIKHTLT